MKNPNIVKCEYCGEDIDTVKATKDHNHEYVKFVNKNIFVHLNICFDLYEKELREQEYM